MSFRDDRDALIAERQNLRRDLAESEERLQAAEAAAEENADTVAELRAQVAELQARLPPTADEAAARRQRGATKMALVAVAALVTMGATIAFLVVDQPSQPMPEAVVAQPTPPMPAAPPTPPPSVDPSESPARLPSRSAVGRALGARRGGVQACANGRTGVVNATIVFRSDGTVQNVQLAAPFNGDTCIQSALRRTRIPPFEQSTFTVTFPYRL